jgi:tetratricopeptide (TPR) repeat protein
MNDSFMSSNSLLRVFLVGCAILTIGLMSTPAFAGPEEAKEFYSQAKDAYQAGEFARAADLLERAYAEDPNLIYQYNRILALQAMGDYEEAMRLLEIYENPMREDGRFDDITEIRAQLEKSIAEKKASTDEKKETDDAKEIADETDEVDDPTDRDTVDGDPDGGNKTRRLVGISLLGAGAASAIVGFPYYTEIALNNKLDNDPSAVEDDVRSRHQTVSIITLSSAVVLGGLGTYFLLSSKSNESASTATSPEGTKAVFTPYMTRGGGGGALILRF